jgi:ribosome-associated translation inhibitor RaiA
MKIQFNIDTTVNWDERQQDFFIAQIAEELKRYQSQLTRIEVHISDENGKKEGLKDIRCLLEARLEGRQPIAITCQAENVELAVSGAIDKIKASLDTILGRISNY